MTAPMTGDMESMFARWKETHVGGMEQFVDMMTRPTPERAAWLHECASRTVVWDGVCAIVEYNV